MTIDMLLGSQRRRWLAAAGRGALGGIAAQRTWGALGMLGGGGLLAALAGCNGGTSPAGQRFSGQTMGSSYTVRLAGRPRTPAQLQRLQAGVQQALDGVDQRMSLYRPRSELVHFNQLPAGQPVALSEPLMTVLQAGQRVAALSAGAFDMTVAPLVTAWGFGPVATAAAQTVPSSDRLQAGRRALGHRALELDTRQCLAVKRLPGLQLDLGGIAKGFGVDMAAQALRDMGVDDFMLEVGGEVRTAGHNSQGRPWQIGIEEPDAVPQRARLVLPLSGQAMATSGDYRIYFEAGGRRHTHEIDPATGEPIRHGLASVTVVAADCMQADALATALIVLGAERGMALAERAGIAAHFIQRQPGGRLVDSSSTALAAMRTAAGA
jgi:thiamine biosynthesis lipoprotein